MIHVFAGRTRAEAWLKATERLLKNEPLLNVILAIENPGSEGALGRETRARLDDLYRRKKKEPIHTVAETIFPAWQYRHRGIRGVYETYTEEVNLLRPGAPGRWGTYADRLVRRVGADKKPIYPLKRLIKKMKSSKRTGSVHFKSCYEMEMAGSLYDIPIYDTLLDSKRLRGLPCLSHLSFKLINDKVSLTAIYRSHDYAYKAPGNLLGLARLQACVAKEVGAEVGGLVVHSTYAFVEGAKPQLSRLVSDFRESERKTPV